jgi:hypothetical protein
MELLVSSPNKNKNKVRSSGGYEGGDLRHTCQIVTIATGNCHDTKTALHKDDMDLYREHFHSMSVQ